MIYFQYICDCVTYIRFGLGITFNMKLTFCARLSLYLYFTYIKRLGPGLTSDKESMSCIRLRLWLQLRRRMRAMSF